MNILPIIWNWLWGSSVSEPNCIHNLTADAVRTIDITPAAVRTLALSADAVRTLGITPAVVRTLSVSADAVRTIGITVEVCEA